MGAVTGFSVAFMTGSPWLGVLAAIIVGALFSVLFGFLTLTLVTNQVATGLALTLLGLGLSGMIGEGFVGLPGVKLGTVDIPYLSDIPYVGRLLFDQDPIFYISIALTFAVSWFLFYTKAGLTLRSVGDNHASAHALGSRLSPSVTWRSCSAAHAQALQVDIWHSSTCHNGLRA